VRWPACGGGDGWALAESLVRLVAELGEGRGMVPGLNLHRVCVFAASQVMWRRVPLPSTRRSHNPSAARVSISAGTHQAEQSSRLTSTSKPSLPEELGAEIDDDGVETGSCVDVGGWSEGIIVGAKAEGDRIRFGRRGLLAALWTISASAIFFCWHPAELTGGPPLSISPL